MIIPRQLASTLFPLSLLSALAGLTLWLSQAVELPGERNDGRQRHDPDYIIENFSLRKLDNQGVLQYALDARELRHYPDQDSTEVSAPRMVSLHGNRPKITMTALRASINSDASELRLFQKVRVQRDASSEQPEFTGETEELLVLPDDEKARTDKPVHITHGRSRLDGTGMELDNAARTFSLNARVTGQFFSRAQ